MTATDLFGSMMLIEQLPSSRFSEFWQHYPRKVAKRTAETAYQHARERASEAEIIAGVLRYAAHTEGTEEKFIAHPATWLNGDRWKDQPRAQSKPLSFMDIVRE